MNKQKHSPGPWAVDFEINDQGPCIFPGKNGSAIAVVYNYCDPKTSKPLSNVKANAHLIAAAPEMFEALQTILTMIPHRVGDCFSNDYMGTCVCGRAMIEKAIAKAKGKTE